MWLSWREKRYGNNRALIGTCQWTGLTLQYAFTTERNSLAESQSIMKLLMHRQGTPRITASTYFSAFTISYPVYALFWHETILFIFNCRK